MRSEIAPFPRRTHFEDLRQMAGCLALQCPRATTTNFAGTKGGYDWRLHLPVVRAHFIVMVPCQALQPICTVALEKPRVKTSLPAEVSLHSPDGSP